ncbi:MAG TPA: hypothetical protein VJW20_02000 [Candidatus Angelobacter sp.]|nr:hypothetical protein [Candidatus Angelobacter sp.]
MISEGTLFPEGNTRVYFSHVFGEAEDWIVEQDKDYGLSVPNHRKPRSLYGWFFLMEYKG